MSDDEPLIDIIVHAEVHRDRTPEKSPRVPQEIPVAPQELPIIPQQSPRVVQEPSRVDVEAEISDFVCHQKISSTTTAVRTSPTSDVQQVSEHRERILLSADVPACTVPAEDVPPIIISGTETASIEQQHDFTSLATAVMQVSGENTAGIVGICFNELLRLVHFVRLNKII